MTAHFVTLLDALRRRSLRMASLVEDMLDEALEAVRDADESLARRVIERDREVDAEEVEVESEVIRLLALYQPVGSDLRLLCTVLKVNNDLERIADCAVNLAERAQHLEPGLAAASAPDLLEMGPIVQRMLRNAVQAYGAGEPSVARLVFAEEQHVDDLYQRVIRRIVADVSDRRCDVSPYLDLLSVAKNLERIADHTTNIAEDVIFLHTGRIVRHARAT